MKNLGKHQVLNIHYFNGTETGTTLTNRVIYQNHEGNYYINYLGSKKPVSVFTGEGGGFIARWHVTEIAGYTLDDILKRIEKANKK